MPKQQLVDGHGSPFGWCYCADSVVGARAKMSCRPPDNSKNLPIENFAFTWQPAATAVTGYEVCPYGCANWSDLASDFVDENQSHVAAKFLQGQALNTTGCASPYWDSYMANDTDRSIRGGLPWCYCKRAPSPKGHPLHNLTFVFRATRGDARGTTDYGESKAHRLITVLHNIVVSLRAPGELGARL